jgi:hypothetical protein
MPQYQPHRTEGRAARSSRIRYGASQIFVRHSCPIELLTPQRINRLERVFSQTQELADAPSPTRAPRQLHIHERDGGAMNSPCAIEKVERPSGNYLGLDENGQSFTWLEHAYKEQSNILQFLSVHPYFHPIRANPRFADLLRRTGLA